MNKTKLVLMLSLFAVLMAVFGNVLAQDTSLPAFRVASVVPDEKVVLTTKDFPADTSYTVSLASAEDPENYTPVAKFNSKSGGSLNVTVKISPKFQGLNTILIKLQDGEGNALQGEFVNIAPEEPAEEPVEEKIELVNQDEPAEEPAETPAEEPAETPAEEPVEKPAEESAETPAEEPVEKPAEESAETPAEEPVEKPAEESAETPAEEPVTEIPVLVCDFSVIPTITVDAVAQNESVTFTTANFPANSTFSVAMGYYISTWKPDPIQPRNPYPGPFPYPQPVPHFETEEHHHGHHLPKGKNVTTFSGTIVGTFETGDGTPQTLTFNIPEALKNVNPIALWIADEGPCGFYSYNYFYNYSTN